MRKSSNRIKELIEAYLQLNEIKEIAFEYQNKGLELPTGIKIKLKECQNKLNNLNIINPLG